VLPLAARVRHLQTGPCGRVLGDRAAPLRRRGPECGTPPAPLQSAAGRVVTCIGRSLLLPYGRYQPPGNNCRLPEGRRRVPVRDADGCTPSLQPGQAPLSVDLRGHTPGRPAPRLIPRAHPASRTRRKYTRYPRRQLVSCSARSAPTASTRRIREGRRAAILGALLRSTLPACCVMRASTHRRHAPPRVWSGRPFSRH